jgi:hypothetical protein
MAQFVDVESPYMGKTDSEVNRNILYARACIRDCLLRGEVPFASHLFFTQPGILDDNVSEERVMGINAGKAIIESLPQAITVVYRDLGISKGMEFGITLAEKQGRTIEYRTLGEGWIEKEVQLAKNHSHTKVWGFNDFT